MYGNPVRTMPAAVGGEIVMDRTVIRAAALGCLAAIGLLIAAPGAPPTKGSGDFAVTSVSMPLIAPEASGTVSVVITNGGTSDPRAPMRTWCWSAIRCCPTPAS